MYAAGAALLVGGGRPTTSGPAEWYGSARQRLLQADLSYRLGQALALLSAETPGAGPIADYQAQLQERAVAEYERQGLGPDASGAALHRLGLIYGARNYATQAQRTLQRAATVYEGKTELLFALAAIYDPQTPVARLRLLNGDLLGNEETWLHDMATLALARRLQDPARTVQAEQARDRHTRVFVFWFVCLLLGYGLLGLVGLLVILRTLLRWAFTVPRRAAPAADLSVPWGPLDSLEIGGVLCLAVALLGAAVSLLMAQPPLKSGPPLLQVAVVWGHYVALYGIIVAVMWRRVPLAWQVKVRSLGFRAVSWAHVGEGLVGYGVLLCLLAVVEVLVVPSTSATLVQAKAGEALTTAAQNPLGAALLVLLTCVVVPLVEEAIFRGYLYAGLRRAIPVPAATVGSALLFGSLHLSLGALIPITLVGIVLAQLYERHRVIWPCVVCHALHNTLVVALLLLVQ